MIRQLITYFSSCANIINLILGLIFGVISGIISGIIVSNHYERRGINKEAFNKLESGKLEFYNYFKDLQHGIDQFIDNKDLNYVENSLAKYPYPFAMFAKNYKPLSDKSKTLIQEIYKTLDALKECINNNQLDHNDLKNFYVKLDKLKTDVFSINIKGNKPFKY